MSRFRNCHTLMVQGTTSDAGKSIVVTALCRILARRGVPVAPFKPQNMALNSAVTADGGEIGRAQAVQAAACFLEPSVAMNPVLLKPNSNTGSQVIVHGRAIGNMQALEYHRYKPALLSEVVAAHQRLQQRYAAVLVEGAGSPAEINLRDNDIANMGFAEAIDCPVILVADIDRGGVFAQLLGTWELLSESERQRLVGFVINRFRGDVSLLRPGLDWLERRCGVPVLGVVPYLEGLHIEAEDSLNCGQSGPAEPDGDPYLNLRVAVPMYPRASNHTDFDVLRLHPQIDCRFVREVGEYQGADLIILPGSKHVRADYQWLCRQGWDVAILRHLRLGGKVLGICGGYQMLGDWIHDPDGVESEPGSTAGLGLLSMSTTLAADKTLRNVRGVWAGSNAACTGYEIHAGISVGSALERPLFELHPHEAEGRAGSWRREGSRSDDDAVFGTYLHGVLDHPDSLQRILQWVGGNALVGTAEVFDYPAYREQQIERLADAVEQVIPSEVLLDLLAMEPA